MSIDIKEVRHLAELSKIQLSDQELESLGKDLTAIVGYINQLDELNTDGIEPTFQLTGLDNVWRQDTIEPQLPRQELLNLAPDQEAGQVKVPKVL